jgi:lysophospholipase L1-like esterase
MIRDTVRRGTQADPPAAVAAEHRSARIRSASMSLPRRRIAFWAVTLALPLICLELGSFALARLRPDLFDDREAVLAPLGPADFARARATVNDRLGWDNPASAERRERNCAGEEVVATYDADRIRLHGARTPRDAVVLVAGDSYTHGNAVADDATYPAALERILGLPTANLGVSGYGADQALLKLEDALERFPNAKVAILSILYDDIARMLNRFRPILQRPTARAFGLKPYVEDGVFHRIPGGNPYRGFDSFVAAVRTAYDADYWRRPRARFPYAASVAAMIVLPSFWIPALTQIGESVGRPRYEPLHRVPAIRRNLRALYGRFADWSRQHGLRAVVVFIPVDARDQTSGLLAIAAASGTQRLALTFHNVAIGDDTYRHVGWCHPSPAGYRSIAESVAAVVRPLLP